MKKKISIIIVTYNSENHIYDCLESILKYNDIGNELEVIVVDNMSSEVDIMFNLISKKFGSEIILTKKNLKNGGYGQGNNFGVKIASAPIILIMNPDVRLMHPIFSKVIDVFKNPSVAMLGMVQMISQSKRGKSFGINLGCGEFRRISETIIYNKINYYNQARMHLAGSCFFIDKLTFEDIGMFDENIFMYGEENDLHYRLITIKPNSIIRFNKKMHYLHLTDNKKISINVWRQILSSSLYFCKKNGINENLVINNSIRNGLFFLFIAKLRNNKPLIQAYRQWLKILKDEYVK